jgi:hypothetical protein
LDGKVSRVTSAMCTWFEEWWQVAPVCALEPAFAAHVVPWLVQRSVATHKARLEREFAGALDCPRLDKATARLLVRCCCRVAKGGGLRRDKLGTLTHLRRENVLSRLASPRPGAARGDYRGFGLDLDLVALSRAAERCGLPAWAVCNVELAIEEEKDGELPRRDAAAAAAADADDGRTNEKLLLDAYRALVSGPHRALV